MTKPKIGLQVFSMRDIWAENPIEAFQIAKDCGYDAVEGIGRFTMGANELRKVLYGSERTEKSFGRFRA